jgi:hypothetical protein
MVVRQGWQKFQPLLGAFVELLWAHFLPKKGVSTDHPPMIERRSLAISVERIICALIRAIFNNA